MGKHPHVWNQEYEMHNPQKIDIVDNLIKVVEVLENKLYLVGA